ncbi:MAG TPA: large conductance mechanosensitive channel protein MscL [Actinomycetota bacterium]|nr:large conductance mechanosensitive channel protein MscL [Actinomycetota bacterium]
MLKEFKAFALRGNVLDLAIGVILGVAFGAVVSSIVDDILMPLIAAVIGETDFSALAFEVRGSVVRYGAFLTAVVNFLLVAVAVFFLVKGMNRLQGRPREDQPKNRPCPFCLSSIPLEARRCPACTSELKPALA